jgi:hypothetical protein
MPRGPRLDCPGALHQLIVHAIERCRIFRSDRDRDVFLDRLGNLVLDSQAGLYAWALVPNHAHALLRTGLPPRPTLARGYATTFNRVHRRTGHLFQNRLKNVLVEEDPCLLKLVRYIAIFTSTHPLPPTRHPRLRRIGGTGGTFHFQGPTQRGIDLDTWSVERHRARMRPSVTAPVPESIPVGAAEITARLGVRGQTVHTWRQRGLLPPPRWTVSGQPAWDWPEIEK